VKSITNISNNGQCNSVLSKHITLQEVSNKTYKPGAEYSKKAWSHYREEDDRKGQPRNSNKCKIVWQWDYQQGARDHQYRPNEKSIFYFFTQC